MRFLVFQHIACEHPGIFRRFMNSAGIGWDAVELDEGEAIPALEPYDGLIVMGGPMDVWDTADHPWLVAEKQAIHTWVRALNRPLLGLCLGHQLAADALGGECGPQMPPEIGILDIELTAAAAADPVFSPLPRTQKCLQWHSVQVTRTPADAVVLARSAVCPVQAMRIGARAWTMQYHIELEAATIPEWAEVPAYERALAAVHGAGALERMKADADRHMAAFEANARCLFDGFLAQVGSR